MIIERKGNMLTNVLPVDLDGRDNVLRIMVHGTNCRGKMRSGIAKSIRELYPEAYKVYMQQHENYGHILGGITKAGMDNGMFYVVNANTQDKYRGYQNDDLTVEADDTIFVDYIAVREAFAQINDFCIMREYATNFEGRKVEKIEIHFPLIGCGLANGDWDTVAAIIDEELEDRFEKVLWKL